MTTELPIDPKGVSSDSRGWAAAAHLVPLFGFGFLAPMIIWFIKRDEDAFVEDQAREALNFQLSMLIYIVASVVVMFLGIAVGPVLVVAGILLFFGFAMYALIGAIIGGVQSASGKLFRYPLILRPVSRRS